MDSPTPPEPPTIALPDGRVLGYARYGKPGGDVVLWMHGFPGCRFEPRAFIDAPARARGLDVIVLERPGYGLSSPKPGRSVVDWAKDVAHAADALDIARFAVIGYSGGGAYALACAHALPERVTSCVTVEALGPLAGDLSSLGALSWWHPQRIMLGLGARMGFVISIMARLISTMGRRNPDFVISRMSPSDRKTALLPEVRDWLQHGLWDEPLVQGHDAVVHELTLALRPWGFPLDAIKVPVHVVQGSDDWNCPPAMGQAIATPIPGSTYTLLAEAGHLLVFDRVDEVLQKAV